MAAPLAVTDFYTGQQRRALLAMVAARSEWGKLSKPGDFDRIANRIFAIVASAQLGAARDGAAMVPAALEQSGYPEPQLANVNPAGFAGVASDGRDLSSLLALTPGIAERAGGTLAEQMQAGQIWLDLAVQRQVADAGRGACGVAITATRNCGWVRYVNPPCCQNCAILAGRVYRWSHGFKRHPRCDCVHRPCSNREPSENYTGTISPDQIHDLTAAQREALAEGADLNRVVNAYRGRLSGRDKMTTTAELSQRGQRRLTPDGIYALTRGDRQQAISLLRTYGYLL